MVVTDSEHSPRNQRFPLMEQVAPSNRDRLWVQKELVPPVCCGDCVVVPVPVFGL